MYAWLHDLLCDRKGGTVFTCFSAWHFVYIAAALLAVLLLCLFLKGRDLQIRRKTATILAGVAFGLYVADFFLMPFAYEAIDIEKLPFHICTATCVACFLSRHVRALGRFRVPFALLGLISNLVYLIYPAGVMWHGVHPLCYRVVQTLLFHAVMTAYGAVTLLFDEEKLSFKGFWRHVVTVAGMTVWALLGNLLYEGAAGTYDHAFNWFFVRQDPFGLFDPAVAPWVMPFLNTTLFLLVEVLIIGIACSVRSCRKKTRSA